MKNPTVQPRTTPLVAAIAKFTSLPCAKALEAAFSHEDIAARAYELFVLRGRADGHDIQDWLQAEHELRKQASSTCQPRVI